MGCCGQKRTALQHKTAVTQPINKKAQPPQAPPAANSVQPAARSAPQQHRYDPGSVRLRYTERSRILVHGPVTGRLYEFSGERSVVSVHVQDADGLLKTRYFVRG